MSLSVSKGRIVGLLGPNGSGKDNDAEAHYGLLRPSAGQVMIDGQAPGIKTKSLISYLPDKSYLNDWMTVSQLIEFFCRLFNTDFSREKAAEMLQVAADRRRGTAEGVVQRDEGKGSADSGDGAERSVIFA